MDVADCAVSGCIGTLATGDMTSKAGGITARTIGTSVTGNTGGIGGLIIDSAGETSCGSPKASYTGDITNRTSIITLCCILTERTGHTRRVS